MILTGFIEFSLQTTGSYSVTKCKLYCRLTSLFFR